MTTYSSTEDILKTLKLLCKREISDNNQSYILGKSASGIQNNEIMNIIDYDTFKSKWIATDKIVNTDSSKLLANIRFKLTGREWSNNPISKYSRSDIINFSKILNEDFMKIIGNESFISILDLLNTIRLTYNILESSIFGNFKAILLSNETTLQVGIPVYELDENDKYYVLTDKNIIKSKIEKIIPNISTLTTNTTNIDVIRRILHGYELLIHCYISNILLTISNTPDDIFTTFNNINVEMTRKIILYNDIILQEGNSNISKLDDLLRKNALIYDTKAEGLEKINAKLDELQTEINIGSSKLEQNKKNFTNQSIMYYITIVLFIIFVSSLALVRNNKQYLRLLSIPIAVLSIVFMSILYTVNKIKIVEAFSTTPNSPTIIENNNVKVLDAFNKYLLHTLYISLLLKSYKHYNVTNDSINKEFNYYNKQEIKQKHINSKIVDSNAVYYLDNKIYEYRSYMLHIITVIITSSVLLSSYTCNKRTVDTIMWSAVMLIVLVIFIYIMNVNNLVRTEPRKLYWYPPKF